MRINDPNRPEWMNAFHALHGVWPIAGGAGDEEPPAPEEGITVEVPEEEAPPAAEDRQTAEPPQDSRFTVEDIEKARKQERDKLYSRIESMEEMLKREREEREAEQRRLAEEEQRAAEEAKRAEEAQMEAKELIERKEQEWQERFRSVEEELQRRDAIEEKEREFQRVQSYREQKLAEHDDEIMPELRDMITGESPEEIDAAISQAIEKTSSILEQVRAQQTQQRQQMPGTRPTAPPMGPVEENDSQQQTLTPDDIRKMSMQDYMKYRNRLKQAVSSRVNQSGPYAGR